MVSALAGGPPLGVLGCAVQTRLASLRRVWGAEGRVAEAPGMGYLCPGYLLLGDGWLSEAVALSPANVRPGGESAAGPGTEPICLWPLGRPVLPDSQP